MDIITENGIRQHVDIDSKWAYEKAALVEEDVYLKEVWVLELNTDNQRHHRLDDFEMDPFKEIQFDHEPSNDEILAAMVSGGLGFYYGTAILRKGYQIGRD